MWWCVAQGDSLHGCSGLWSQGGTLHSSALHRLISRRGTISIHFVVLSLAVLTGKALGVAVSPGHAVVLVSAPRRRVTCKRKVMLAPQNEYLINVLA